MLAFENPEAASAAAITFAESELPAARLMAAWLIPLVLIEDSLLEALIQDPALEVRQLANQQIEWLRGCS